MFDKVHYTKRTYSMIGALLAGILAVVIGISAVKWQSEKTTVQVGPQDSMENGEQDPLRYLPDGAKIRDPSKEVIFADLDGDGTKEQIIFFSLPHQHKVGIAVLRPTGKGYRRVWQEILDDSGSFADPSGIYDLNNTGRPQIIAYRAIGTSCPGALEIYEYRNGNIERISGPWASTGHCEAVEIKDLNGDGRREIIVRVRSYGLNPDVYGWNGKRYVKSNSEFAEYYNNELSDLIRDIHSTEALPTNARVNPSKQAVKIYLLQSRYAEAVALCNDVLRMLDDPQLTKPNAIITEKDTPDQLNYIAAGFDIDKVQAKADVHRLLGDIYKVSGNPQQAQTEIHHVQELELRAKEMRSKLPTMKLVPVN